MPQPIIEVRNVTKVYHLGDVEVHSQAHLNRIAQRLNQRPRKTLGYRTPAAMLAAALR
jgi:IS30 family transposase